MKETVKYIYIKILIANAAINLIGKYEKSPRSLFLFQAL